MKKISCLLFLCGMLATAQDNSKVEVAETLDAWHLAAGNADFDTYFGLMTDDAVFIGTDAMENWGLKEFKAYAKPHFDKGRAWSFKAVARNIYLNDTHDLAWFDELLDTQMKLCRGSGVLRRENGTWRIAHYVLSIAVPNEYVDQLVEIKENKDNLLLNELTKN
ncbi:nuclear transport factor 2 family protein [Maribacter thermophilus]|uniref:nuclear transport factor 2 family protein n=1 Tax=Maribacter thermophilus TaxID=1197874 RepID=UPI0006411F5E|nr:nuclear transport factor 2 family protein [Maribacter thermophilus]